MPMMCWVAFTTHCRDFQLKTEQLLNYTVIQLKKLLPVHHQEHDGTPEEVHQDQRRQMSFFQSPQREILRDVDTKELEPGDTLYLSFDENGGLSAAFTFPVVYIKLFGLLGVQG